ncbi:MAG TPA: RNA polymerase sigma factor [Pseudolysinimonas sp.]|nr:RNA polymerase sigma factor [Pseudolysinimonas sp.]
MKERVELDLDTFVATEYPKVVAAVGMITGNRQDAADAVQDAIVGFLAKPPAREITNVAAWITVVATNRARDIQRSKGAESRALAKVGVDDESTDADTAAGLVDSLDIDVKRAIETLPLQQRQVCVLHYLLDQSVETIAEGLGVSSGTIKTQLFRARKSLAAQLRKEDHRG